MPIAQRRGTPQNPWTPGGDTGALEQWMTRQLQLDPSYQLPEGYAVGEDGQVRRSQPGFLLQHPWLIPLLGAGAGAGLAAAGIGGAAAGIGPQATGAAYPGAGLFGAPATAAGGGASAGGGGILGALGRFSGPAADIGEIVSGGAAGLASGRRDDALTNLAVNTANNRALVDVGTFNRDTPSVRASQTARGDLMANVQPYQLSGSGRNLQGTGGLTPAAFGPNTRTAGQTLASQGLQALQSQSDRITPQIAQPTRAGRGENIAGGIGTGLSILGALGRFRR